ncbi:hypothetical protein GGI08_006907, partial [Coemansia sp. S2]
MSCAAVMSSHHSDKGEPNRHAVGPLDSPGSKYNPPPQAGSSSVDESATRHHSGLASLAVNPPLPFTHAQRPLHPMYTLQPQLPLASQPWSPDSVQGRSMQVGSEPHYILPHRRQSMLAKLTSTSSSAIHVGQPNVADEVALGVDHRRRSEASIPLHTPANHRSPPPLVFIPVNIEKIKRTYDLKPRERQHKPTLSSRARSPRGYETSGSNSRCHPRPPSKLTSATQPTILPPLSVALQQFSRSPSSMQLSLSPIRPASAEEINIGSHNILTPTVGPAYDTATPYFHGRYHEPSAPQESNHCSYGYHPAATNFQNMPPVNQTANEYMYRPHPLNVTSPRMSA